MSTFIQAHFLVAYPAANLNRDDSGRPKTMIYGGAERLRVSSQSLKRAIRTSPTFEEQLQGYVGSRSQTFGKLLEEELTRPPYSLSPDQAAAKAKLAIEADKLGKIKTGSDTEQLAHLSPEEMARLTALAARVASADKLEEKDAIVLTERPKAADIAMFGRMLADNSKFNVEAAAQVAHAFTTHRAVVEDDYFTAVDELKAARKEADKGAGFVGVAEFGTGLFYLYTCVNASLLADNLRDDKELAGKTAAAFVEALAKTSPSGKQNSFASRGHAIYGLVETGRQQPRSLAAAFLKPVDPNEDRGGNGGDGGGDPLKASAVRIMELRNAFGRAYGPGSDRHIVMDVMSVLEGAKYSDPRGNLADLCRLAADAAHNAEPLRTRRHAA